MGLKRGRSLNTVRGVRQLGSSLVPAAGQAGEDRVQVASAEPRGEALQGSLSRLSSWVCSGSLNMFPGKMVMSGNRMVSQGVIKNSTESTEKWPSPGTHSEFIFY